MFAPLQAAAVYSASVILIVCPLQHEAAAIQRAVATLKGVQVVVCGPGQAAAASAVDSIVIGPTRPSLVILAGCAGGLVPTPAIVEIEAVLDERGQTLGTITRRFANLPPAYVASIAAPVTTVAAKASLSYRCSQRMSERPASLIVDTESAGFKAGCERHGLTFAIVRAISDGPGHALPSGVEHWIDVKGRTKLTTVLAALVQRPWLLPSVVALGRRTNASLARLGSVLHDELKAELSRATSGQNGPRS